jgi:alpha-L-arabinofuranosidase
MFAGQANIEIDFTKRGPQINPHMYGIFLEEINHGVDGGLYAELIRNRAFEDSRSPEGYALQNGRWVDSHGFDSGFSRYNYTTEDVPFWALVQKGDAKGALILNKTGGITKESCYCVTLDIEDNGDSNELVGIANEGFFGIGIKSAQSYKLSLYASSEDGFKGTLKVYFEDAQGQRCSTVVAIKKIEKQWKQFSGILKADKTEKKARLLIGSSDKGRVKLDFVSLFPTKSWKNQVNGLRPDLAQMIADLKPGFVRFPGGCIVEGGTVETAYNWKLTVGPLENRQERWGPWNYRRTQGMGLYEYFRFCEDIGSEPLWVGFAGQTCIFREREHVPMSDMQWVLDGFLDIVEYANGPTTSKWGAMRAKAGHPESFELKHVEIGNENAGPEYGKRYRYIHKAMKEKYPHIKYLADLSWTSVRSLGDAEWDIEDRHYYQSPQWFSSRFHAYDDRDRNLPPLYLGEVAVTSGRSTPLRGNLLAALSEGIYLMGCERNADTVSMVSYAPLLGHVEGRTELTNAPPPWHAMIYFDGTDSFGTVSYYLWKLFGANRPDYTVQTNTSFPGAGESRIAGSAGVGTWGTSAEYKDIKVEKDGKVLYESDFSNGSGEWNIKSGRWSVQDGAYQQASTRNGLSVIGEEDWSDYTLTMKARKIRGGEGFLIVFGCQGDNEYWWNIGGWGNSNSCIEQDQMQICRPVDFRLKEDRWYDVKVVLKGNHIKCYLDGKLMHETDAPKRTDLYVVSGRDEQNGDVVIKAINMGDNQPAALNLKGVNQLDSTARVTVLTSEGLYDNNSLSNPDKIIPKENTFKVDGNKIEYTFCANSFTLIRIGIND